MKKFLLALVCSSAMVLSADVDLRVQKFADITGGTAKVISTGWKNYGLDMKASADRDVTATYRQLFTYYPNMIYELSADIRGNGTPFAVFNFLNADGSPCKVDVPVNTFVKGDDFKAVLDLRNVKLTTTPARFTVSIGVKKGGSVIFEDVELEIDND